MTRSVGMRPIFASHPCTHLRGDEGNGRRDRGSRALLLASVRCPPFLRASVGTMSAPAKLTLVAATDGTHPIVLLCCRGKARQLRCHLPTRRQCRGQASGLELPGLWGSRVPTE